MAQVQHCVTEIEVPYYSSHVIMRIDLLVVFILRSCVFVIATSLMLNSTTPDTLERPISMLLCNCW